MKTGNSWEDLHNFKAQPRKYRPVQLEKRRSPPPRELPMNLSGPCPSRLPPPLQRLLRNLAEPELLARAPLSLGSEGQVALELLSQESLNTALALLEDIRQLVQEKASIQASAEQHQQESKLPELMLRIVEKSEELYCLIPVRGRRFERLEPLFEERGVQRMAALVHSLVHLQLATQLLLGAQLKAAELHPLDYVYRSLRCKVQLLQEHVAEAQTVLQYVLNSAKTPPRVVGVYRVTREGEPQRLASCELSNHWLLWHATRASNLLGILASGLEVQPLAQHWNGDPMAKGICLADRLNRDVAFARPIPRSMHPSTCCSARLPWAAPVTLTWATRATLSRAPPGATRARGLWDAGSRTHSARSPGTAARFPLAAATRRSPCRAP
ncbi:poly [ADP-ribose] polymerase, putative [Ixodes scapularis]|uniref:Poly [ADP-ribose] polymerase, putative n=1 Tax=Ixodes scapularis TaxID=6945 RepID=B7PV22_IXOSC|nr:poly [ADP-ribose] polymerase, putative [Ixodes scapularis]|eukprot:XP_002407157.1 poly [ADP-ribose] polymerase, putative [Ixodes scapularis]